MNMSATETMAGDISVQDEMARAIAAAQDGDKLTAHKIFQSLAARNGHMPDLWVWLGGTSSNLDEAEAAFQRAAMLDPTNEEANLGLRWVALRRQVLSSGSDNPVAAMERSSSSTAGLASGSLTSSSLGTGSLSSTTSADSANPADADKAMKMKVGKARGRRTNIPLAAILLFGLSLVLYGIVLWFLIFK
jgi:cobalamin biosynthesis Mg chelatase CobN